MRIVIDARESGTSTGRYVDKLVEYLYRLRPQFEIIILTKTPRLDFFKKIAPGFKVLKSDYKEFTFAEQIGLYRQLNSLEPDLVHFTVTQQPVLYSGKVITTIHDLTTARFGNPVKNRLIYWLKQQVYKWVIKRVARKSAKVITPSKYIKEDVAQYAHINSGKIVVTYEAADKIMGQPEPMMELEDKHFLLYVGRAQPHKNLKLLIDAYQEIRKLYPGLMLVLAGKEDQNYKLLQRYAEQKKTSGVMFTDFVPDSQLRWLYEHASAYVFPSLSEGFGLPGLEAMLYGLPVISSNATCLPEIYGDGALYFDPKSTKELVNKVKQLLADPELARDLAAKGQKVAESYSWKRMAKQTLDVYNDVLNGR